MKENWLFYGNKLLLEECSFSRVFPFTGSLRVHNDCHVKPSSLSHSKMKRLKQISNKFPRSLVHFALWKNKKNGLLITHWGWNSLKSTVLCLQLSKIWLFHGEHQAKWEFQLSHSIIRVKFALRKSLGMLHKTLCCFF